MLRAGVAEILKIFRAKRCLKFKSKHYYVVFIDRTAYWGQAGAPSALNTHDRIAVEEVEEQGKVIGGKKRAVTEKQGGKRE